MKDEKTIVVLSRDTKRRTEEITRFGYTLISSKPITVRQAKDIDSNAVVSKDEEHYTELIFVREKNIQKYSNIKFLETRYFNIIDEAVPSMKYSNLAVQICGFSILGLPLLPFALIFRNKMRKKVQEAISANMANDNTRKGLALQAETVLKQP